ncbi:MAG: OadG family protein [Anaerolineaceae bacterium]|nr:OadG family protein [Anaerolineaceae bacterium]
MENALLITLFGMSLVFLSILLLWGLMALLVRLTREPEPAEAQVASANSTAAGAQSSALEQSPDQVLLIERKRRAAAAAVAMALSMHSSSSTPTINPVVKTPPALVSAWQAVHRAGQISQRGNFARKKVAR